MTMRTSDGSHEVVVVPPPPLPWGVRFAWFVSAGWLLGLVVVVAAWFVLVVGVVLPVLWPVGAYLLNRLPSVITLRPSSTRWELRGGVWRERAVERPWLLRAGWFLAVGWWLSAAWLVLAYLVSLTIVGIPLAFWMFDRVGFVATLAR